MPSRQKKKTKQEGKSHFGVHKKTQQSAGVGKAVQNHLLRLSVEDEDCSFWPSDSLVGSMVKALNDEVMEEELLEKMTSLSLVVQALSAQPQPRAILFQRGPSDPRQKCEEETADEEMGAVENQPQQKPPPKAVIYQTMRDFTLPVSFSQKKLREIRNFTRFVTRFSRQRRRSSSSSSLRLEVEDSSDSSLLEGLSDSEESEVGMTEETNEGEVSLRRCLSVPHLSNFSSLLETIFEDPEREIGVDHGGIAEI